MTETINKILTGVIAINLGCLSIHTILILGFGKAVIFVETPAVKEVSQIIETKHKCLIIGESGIGKSMLLHHIALQLLNKEEYSIVPCSGIKDILNHYKKDVGQLFVIDDICGPFTLSVRDTERLLKNEETLLRILEKGNTNILATCRLDIYNDDTFRASCTVSTPIIFNLSVKYSKEDKLTICSKCILLHTDIEVFNERTQLESINEKCGKFTMIILGKYENDYFERIKNALQLGKLIQCFCKAQMKHENYKALFLNVLKSLDNNYFIDNHIIKESYRGYYEIVEYFISKNIDLDEGYSYHEDNRMGDIPLTVACNNGNEKTVQLLIDKGCDVKQIGQWSETPLTAACSSGNEKIVQLLLDKGCDVYQVSNISETPLTAACNSEHEKIVQLLIGKGCDVNQVDGWDEIPLTAACDNGNEKIVKLLIDKGCDVNKVDGLNETPLTASCNSGNEKLVQLLIDKGCDINEVDGMGNTPLTAARRIYRGPWSKVAADISHLNGNDYILIVDYYSKWPEIHKLDNLTSKNTIAYLKSTFSRCGIPDIFYSDNGVQFSSLEFKDFAKDYGFQHLTSSPTYAQSNGQAERTVQTIKSLLKKSKDPYKSLLDYRNTAITELELSPAQIFYGRRLKTTLPTTAPLLNVNNSQDIRRKLKERQSKQKHYYDRHSKPLEPLQNGQKVLVHDGNKWSKHATVKRKHHTPRSYVVETADGRLYRRNRKHLRPTKCNKDQHTQNIVPIVNHNHQVHKEVINTPSADETSACVTQSVVTKTRSGRNVQIPTKFNDYVR
ncbi:Hypothetical predicted protein [Mytilus galloprovincialis]|uniref:Integrase catalytic domain-containing protein n=1 Tax=Mytilus galloprovincialis TaxID=29158 RepID=A0A8B6GYQ7_MYTGA|nr:Hypothetical predicted protein [Mytilus galloprovincialis]